MMQCNRSRRFMFFSFERMALDDRPNFRLRAKSQMSVLRPLASKDLQNMDIRNESL